MKRHLLPVFLLFAALTAAAQQPTRINDRQAREDKRQERRQRINEMLRHEEEGEPSFRSHTLWGFKVNHDGYGISWEQGRMNTPYKATILQVELNDKRHPKEEKQSTGSSLGSGFIVLGNPFVYGKINYFYQLKGAFGQQFMIGNKGNKNGVAVYGIYSGGLSLGLLRPYYIDVQAPPGRPRTIRYSAADSAAFLGQYIIGGTGITTGWKDMRPMPGIHGKGALRFDWSRFNNSVTALEFGFNFEMYTGRVQQMATIDGKRFFANGYVSLVFGKRK